MEQTHQYSEQDMDTSQFFKLWHHSSLFFLMLQSMLSLFPSFFITLLCSSWCCNLDAPIDAFPLPFLFYIVLSNQNWTMSNVKIIDLSQLAPHNISQDTPCHNWYSWNRTNKGDTMTTIHSHDTPYRLSTEVFFVSIDTDWHLKRCWQHAYRNQIPSWTEILLSFLRKLLNFHSAWLVKRVIHSLPLSSFSINLLSLSRNLSNPSAVEFSISL